MPPQTRLLREAIRKRRIVQMTYRDGAERASDRRVRPLAIWSFTEGWMFAGWCELRADFRTFRFDRILDLALTADRFEETPATSLATFLARDSCEGPAAPSHQVGKDSFTPVPASAPPKGQRLPNP